MYRRHVATLFVGLGLWTGFACANGNVYVSYDADGTPRFSSQPYDQSYSLYIRGHDRAAVPVNKKSPKVGLAERRTALTPIISDTARAHGLDAALLAAVIEIESAYNATAVSPKGAVGAMQLIPKTASDYGVSDPYDLRQNLNGGARYLRDLIAAHNGNLPLALAAYNAGRGRVAQHNQRIPPYQETMLYVPRVLARMESFQRDGLFEGRP